VWRLNDRRENLKQVVEYQKQKPVLESQKEETARNLKKAIAFPLGSFMILK